MLYILTLDCGDEEPRQIVSSIVPFYKPEELQDKHIVLVYNLKPANFRGVRSNGMLLAASEAVSEGETTAQMRSLGGLRRVGMPPVKCNDCHRYPPTKFLPQ